MSDAFRELLKKVGSGVHTGEDLTQTEAEAATVMMLQQEATPAQIGAFMLAHRIKRPTPVELAGMLDAYDRFAPKIDTNKFDRPVVVFGNPYDGRSRTAPVSHIVVLMLAAAGIPVMMHGGDCMPTKYGIPAIEIWQKLGIDFSQFSLLQVREILAKTGVGFIYLPQHFVLADKLVPYRDQIGKRPPFATLELIWSPCVGNMHIVAGFVHPPTEERFRATFELRGVHQFTTVKGLEGSCDLPRSRTAIIGLGKNDSGIAAIERLHLNPRDYNLGGKDIAFESSDRLIQQLQEVLQGKATELMPAAILNGGFYLWRFGICPDLASGLTQAEAMLSKGKVAEKLQQLQIYGKKQKEITFL